MRQPVTLSGGAAERVRFSVSPLWETVSGLRLIENATREVEQIHDRWITWAGRRLDGVRPDRWHRLLRILLTRGTSIPEFLIVTPGLRSVSIGVEIDAIAATPPDRVRAAIDDAFAGHPLRPDLEPIVSQPRLACRHLAERLAALHDTIIAPIWPRLAGVLEGDVDRRSRQLIEFGISGLVPHLHDSIRWNRTGLVIGAPQNATRLPAHDRDLVFIPSAFTWPEIYLRYTPHRIALCYPALGFGSLWQRPTPPTDSALEFLIGRNRARLLRALERPATVSELAARLGITPSAVSQHLATLRSAGLAVSLRSGKETTSLRTALGHALVDGQPAQL